MEKMLKRIFKILKKNSALQGADNLCQGSGALLSDILIQDILDNLWDDGTITDEVYRSMSKDPFKL